MKIVKNLLLIISFLFLTAGDVIKITDKSFKEYNEVYIGEMNINFSPNTERYVITYWYCPSETWHYGWTDEDNIKIEKVLHGFEINYNMPVRAEIISYIKKGEIYETSTHFEYFNNETGNCPID